jgi:hypothetical protein
MTTIVRPIKTIDAAAMLGIAPITLRIWRCEGKGPKFTKLGTGRNAPVVYQLADIQAWIDEHKFQSATGYSPAALANKRPIQEPVPKERIKAFADKWREKNAPVVRPWQKPNN